MQQKSTPKPPQLILAGAGTCKTTTITGRIAYMVEKENIDPSQILALTFSREAARNMREKEILSGVFCGQCHYKVICKYKK